MELVCRSLFVFSDVWMWFFVVFTMTQQNEQSPSQQYIFIKIRVESSFSFAIYILLVLIIYSNSVQFQQFKGSDLILVVHAGFWCFHVINQTLISDIEWCWTTGSVIMTSMIHWILHLHGIQYKKCSPPPRKKQKQVVFVKSYKTYTVLIHLHPLLMCSFFVLFFFQIPFVLIYGCLKNSNVITTGRNLWLLANEQLNSWMWHWQGGG